MRLFVAIEIPRGVREKILAVQRTLADTGADVRWMPREQFHITVKFLKDVEENRAGEWLERVISAARQVRVFPLAIEGIGRMPEKGPVRVIASRVISPDQRITHLHRLIDSAAGGMGLAMDTRVLVPHLTLGRVSSNRGLNRLLRMLEKHDLDFFGEFPVQRVVLFQSFLGAGTGGGAKHGVVGTGALAAEKPAAPPS